ncbi:MAG: PIN domain-containing protein [Caldilineales bacterium]
MILLDSDILIDLLRSPPAMSWFDALPPEEELAVSGYVVMELIQGCRNKTEQDRVYRALAGYGVVWLSAEDCDRALDVFARFRLSHNAGLLDVLIGHTSLAGHTSSHVQPEALQVHPQNTNHPTLLQDQLTAGRAHLQTLQGRSTDQSLRQQKQQR